MKNKLLTTFSVLFLTFFAIKAEAAKAKHPWLDTSLSFEERAWTLVDELTLEEKVGQMMHEAPAIDRLDIPSYNWWNEALHGAARSGYATVFPQAIGLAATFNTDMMYKVADVISTEARAKYNKASANEVRTRYYGLTFWSPNINIFRDPRWGRGQETYGEDPYLTGQMGMQFVKGLQGDDQKYFKVVATAKHYAVHNGPEPARHHFNVIPTIRDLYETYLPAFEDLMVKARAYSIMGAYNRVDGESASASNMLLQDILRNKWGFEGYVVSDCGAIEDIWLNHQIVNTPAEAATLGARRGCDLNCGVTYKALVDAVREGLIDEDELDLNVYRLMLAKMKLGMFDPAEKVSYSKIPYEANNAPEHDKLSLKMARESIVLLKNADNTLPLDKTKIKTVAVIGPSATNVEALLGNYNPIPIKPVTVLDGIRNAVGKNVEVIYTQGCPLAEGFDDVNNPIYTRAHFKTGRGAGAKTGLNAEYFGTADFSGKPILTRVENNLDYYWDFLWPLEGDMCQEIIDADKTVIAKDFSARWTGTIMGPERAGQKLIVGRDDRCRILIDGKKVFEDLTLHKIWFADVEVKLEPGKEYDIVVEYIKNDATTRIVLGWKDPLPGTRKLMNEALEAARKADAVIFVGGMTARIEGEEMPVSLPGFSGGDRTDLTLPSSQVNLLRALATTKKPVISVMLVGSAIACQWEQENIPAIVCGWYPGQNGGTAIADVLFGKYNPAGRLPVTFYKSVDQLGHFEDYNMTNKTYRYFTGQPLYAFGYGLSYTSFTYSDLKINKNKVKADDTIKVTFTVTNTGEVNGDEVPQLYVRDVDSSVPMPLKQLRSFDRIHLKAGESKKVTMTLVPSQDMRYYKPQIEDYTVEPGEFEIQIGAASDDIRLRGSVTVR